MLATPPIAAGCDELLYALRRESGVRTLNKTDIVRGLIDRVGDPQVRAKLLRVLAKRHERA